MKIECGEYSNEFDITFEEYKNSTKRTIFGLTDKENFWSKDNLFKPILEIRWLVGEDIPIWHISILGVTDSTYTSNVNITYSYNGIIEEPNYKEPYVDYDYEAKLVHYNKAPDIINAVKTNESNNVIPIVFTGGDSYYDNGSTVEFDYSNIIDHIMIDGKSVNLNDLKSYDTNVTYDDEDSEIYGEVNASYYYLGIKADPGYHTIKYYLKNITENPMVFGSVINPPEIILEPKDMQPFNSLKLLKRSIVGKNITLIPRRAYYESGLETIMIPDSVTSIGEEAFFQCDKLMSIILPDSLTSIGNLAFANCTNLTSIIFKGTIQKWNAITKGNNWRDDVPSMTIVSCMDGNVELD